MSIIQSATQNGREYIHHIKRLGRILCERERKRLARQQAVLVRCVTRSPTSCKKIRKLRENIAGGKIRDFA